MLHLIIFSLVLSLSNCSKSIDPDDMPRIDLTAENIGATEVWLRFTYNGFSDPREYAIERDGKRIVTGVLQKADTLIIDTTALAQHNYTYKAIRLERGNQTIINASVQVTTLDTTSHNVTWQVDTLGIEGTIYDVWAFSKDNIWAVGEIYLRDSTGERDPVSYNLARWNGQRWNITRVMFSICNNQNNEIGIAPFVIRSVYAFGLNDIWLASGGSLVHWDGVNFTRGCLGNGVIQGELLKLWGTSSSNMFCVGRIGTIIRYNGAMWQKMESGTTVDLEDIWGIDDQHIWTTGTSNQDGRCVVLSYRGGGWMTVYDSFGKPIEFNFGFSSIWANNPNVLYLGGESKLRSLSSSYGSFRRLESVGQYATRRIRGINQNDIFVAREGNEILHYNGANWHLYSELKALGGFAFWRSVYPSEDFVIVGGELFTGLFGLPVVVRGSK